MQIKVFSEKQNGVWGKLPGTIFSQYFFAARSEVSRHKTQNLTFYVKSTLYASLRSANYYRLFSWS